MYICENVQSHESKCTIPKKDQFQFSYILICYAILSPLFLQNCVLFCCNPQYKLVLLLEKYLFLCKYPRGYFVSKCQDTVKKILMIFKDNSNIQFIINYFNSWYKDGKDEYFISLFVHFKVMFLSGRAFWVFEQLQSYVSGRVKPTCSSLLRQTKTVQHSENGMMGLYNLHQPSARKQHYRFIFYKIYMFPHENISKQTGVFNQWILLIKINIHCPLSIFLYQKITVYIGGSAHFRSVCNFRFQRTTCASWILDRNSI